MRPEMRAEVKAEVKALTVLYDARCAVCRRARAWLEKEPKYVPIAFVPAGSPHAQQLFPALDAEGSLGELTVVGDNGSVYRGAKAFITCLWALKDYRAWSLRLATPELLPSARRFFVWFSENRFTIGKFLTGEGPLP